MRVDRYDCETVEVIELLPDYLGNRIIKAFEVVNDNKVLLNLRFSNKDEVTFAGLIIDDVMYEYDINTLEQSKDIKMFIELMRFCAKEYLESQERLERQYEQANKLWDVFKAKRRVLK